jgi:hypothetical protein
MNTQLRPRYPIASCLVAFLFWVPPARGAVLGTWDYFWGGQGQGEDGNSSYPVITDTFFNFYFGGNPALGAVNPTEIDLSEVDWSPNDVGSTVTVTSSNTNFANVAALLTDGIDEEVAASYMLGRSGASDAFAEPESYAFNQPANAPGFSGDQITSIQFSLLSFSWGHAYFLAGFSYEYETYPELQIVETINGTPIPEPSGIAFAFFGVVLMRFRRRM